MKKIISLIVIIIVGIFSSYAADNSFGSSYEIKLNNLPEEVIHQILTSVSEDKSLDKAIERFYNLRLVSKGFRDIVKDQLVQKLFIVNCIEKFGEQAFQALFDKLAEDLDKSLSKIKFLLKNYNLLKKSFANLSTLKVLIEACDKGYAEIVNLLISNGANINALSVGGNSPLTVAAIKGHTNIIKILLDNGADIQNQTLISAAYNGHTEMVNLLITSGADVQDLAVLFSAVGQGHTKIVEVLIANGTDIDTQSFGGSTALTVAAREGHTEMVNLLIANGANINILDNSSEYAALTEAAEKGHIEVVKILIANGANINTQIQNFRMAGTGRFPTVGYTVYGRTALMLAAYNGHTEIVDLLISYGADVNAQDSTGCTALTLAVSDFQLTTVKLLCNKGANKIKMINKHSLWALIFSRYL